MLRQNSKVMEEVKLEDDEDDEESLDEEEFLQLDEEEEVKEKAPWDQFKDQPHESDSISMADTSFIDIVIQILKLLAYAITFMLVLGGAAIAKSLFLLMTSQLTPDRNITVKMGSMYLNLQLPDVEKYLWIWALLITFSIPELATLVRSIRYTIFKGYESRDEIVESEMKEKTVSNKTVFFVTAFMETLHSFGLAIFVFEVLPQLDVAKGVMLTNCVCLVPGLLNVLPQNTLFQKKKFKLVADIFAILFQISGFIAFPVVLGPDIFRLWLIPLSLFLISCTWWMNFVFEESRLGMIKFLGKIKKRLKEEKVFLYKNYMIISVWKILVFVATALLILQIQGMNLIDFLNKFGDAFSERDLEAQEVDMIRRRLNNEKYYVSSIGSGIWWVIGAQVGAAFLCYFSGKFACSVMIQRFSFALPCALVVPLVVFLVVLSTALRHENPNFLSSILPNYVFFNAPQIYEAEKFIVDEFAWLWILWLLSQIWITYHIWLPRCERLSMTEKLFATPMFSGFLVEQSLALNRRRDEIEIMEKEEGLPPHIIACATMWHETKPEMLEMLKSLLRVDNDQCLKKSAKNNVNDPEAEANFYTFEAHIFFDDAFELESEESTRTIINTFVRDFIKIIRKATKDVYGTDDIWIKPPLKYSTPYGGRLEYTMPGENKLFVHLKDKDKIRHKKRWSQVMYMYYLLGYKLMDQPIPYKQKMEKAENTFILALDGDIDFKPDAVLLLVDLMKKNKDLGAACGRIHPVGSGFMVWYQMFEYAIGHWLQKATEHVIGCVLCSPGCFSLFRGKALMSSNVMKRYTTKAEEARHYVQYDQGEDRWLCTLLLQRGYRVEYSAASDAYTHCPESFDEFFTQRRRWVPSTLANILDLLNDYKRTIKVNNDISLPYIIYQIIMLLSNIIGPGTILLMLVGAFNAAFKIDNWTALYYNLIPVFGFMLLCLFTKQKFQLSAALVISLVYGLIMMAVLVGIAMEISDDGLLSPSALFLFTTAGEIVLAGIFHPQEFLCLFSGVIYYVTIPSMYLLLIIYSFCNLNEVSWGTREVAKKKTKEDLENEKREAELAEKKAQKNKFFGVLESVSGKQNKEENGALEFSLSNIFKCMCCTSEKPNPNNEHYVKIGETLQVLSKKMDDIERNIQQGNADMVQFRKSTMIRMSSQIEEDLQNVDLRTEENTKNNILIEKTNGMDDDEMRDDLFNPYWIEDKDLRKSKFEVLNTQEITFWKELIKAYLHPLIENKEKKEKIKKNLKELRDKVVVTFFMLNALFVVTVFLLQVNKDTIFIKWPLGAKANITFNTVNYEITIEKKYLQLEPIGLTFISFFASVLLIQFLAMLIHRFETLCHLLSNTPLTILKGKKALTFREKLEYARKKFIKQNAEQAAQQENLTLYVEPLVTAVEPQVTPVEKRKSRIIPDERFNSIFQEMKEEEEREMAEKQERRRSSFVPWKRNSLQDNRLSRQFSSHGSNLEKIEE